MIQIISVKQLNYLNECKIHNYPYTILVTSQSTLSTINNSIIHSSHCYSSSHQQKNVVYYARYYVYQKEGKQIIELRKNKKKYRIK